MRRSSNSSSRIRQILALAGLLLGSAFAAQAQKYPMVTLTWDASLDATVAGYRIYARLANGDYTNTINVGLLTRSTIPLMGGGGTYYFTVTAYSSDGVESGFSNEVSYTPLVLSATLVHANSPPWGPPGQDALPPKISLQWHSDPGTTYRVLYKNSLTDTNWTDLSGEILAIKPVTSWSEPVLSTVLCRFYCVIAVPLSGEATPLGTPPE